MSTKISVAMCTYNGSEFLKQQIDSILNQTQKVDEIVICDDNSSDDTFSILQEYHLKFPKLFKIHKNEVNLKSVKNFEKAIRFCSGDFIFLADQDDLWIENKVSDFINYFQQNQNIEVLASGGICINSKSEILDVYTYWDIPFFLSERGVSVDFERIISTITNLATGATMAFRKNFVATLMPFPELHNLHHDEWIALHAARQEKFAFLNGKYILYRIHTNQQVGGIAFKKDDDSKELFTNIYDVDNMATDFKSLKRRLNKIILSYKKDKALVENDVEFKQYFIKKQQQNKFLATELKK